jgi:hypothetical protein
LNSLAKTHADEVFEQELTTNRGEQDQIVLSVKRLEDERNELADKKRTKKIKNRFLEFLSKFFHDLSVDPNKTCKTCANDSTELCDNCWNSFIGISFNHPSNWKQRESEE